MCSTSLDLVLRALARIDVGDVQDRLLAGIEHLQDLVGVAARRRSSSRCRAA